MKIPYCINCWLLSYFSMSVGQKVYVSLFRFIIHCIPIILLPKMCPFIVTNSYDDMMCFMSNLVEQLF